MAPGDGDALCGVTALGLVEAGAGAEVFTPGSRSSGRGALCAGVAAGAGGGLCCAMATGTMDAANRPTTIHLAGIPGEVLSYIVMLLLSDAEWPPGATAQQVSGPGQMSGREPVSGLVLSPRQEPQRRADRVIWRPPWPGGSWPRPAG